MAILIKVNGNAASGGFLVAPDGTRTFPVPLGLQTNDGTTVNAVLQQAAGGATLVFSQTNVTIGPTETFVTVHASTASAAAADTVLQVAVGAVVQASFTLTAIRNPQLWFQGRFQARFATDNDFYNHPRGTSSGANVALIGEPDFVPADNVPTVVTKPVGREIRFHNPVALRSHVPAIGVSVVAIRGSLSGAGTVDFTVGDPILGLPVDLGPNSYFAGNRPKNPADPAPVENYPPGQEPIGLFEFHVGTLFQGASLTPDRPITFSDPSTGAFIKPLSAGELSQYGVVSKTSYRNARKTALVNDYNGLSAADQAGTPGQNIKTRLQHLGGGVLGLPSTQPDGDYAWEVKEEFAGLVNTAIQFSPHNSPVLTYLAGYGAFTFFGKFLNYHTDDQCGQVHGSLEADPTTGIPPLTTGVYNVQSREAAPFAALNAAQLTDSAVDTVLAAGSVPLKAVVTVSSSLGRLVVSQAVLTNPADPPASWQIASRGKSLVGKLLPAASVFPRDLYYEILPPGHQENVLGVCEGTPFPPPAPALGYARLYYDTTAAIWKLLLHAGTNAADGVTYKGTWSGATATTPTGCVAPDVELLTPTVNFGNVEQGMVMYREIVLLNRSAGPVTITLPALAAPFSPPGATSVTIAPGATGTLLVAFTAGAPGPAQSTTITLLSNPVVSGSLDVSLIGTPVAVSTVDIALVLDRSGSMAEPALTGVRFATKADVRNQAVQMLIEMLRDADRIGLVRFNQDAQVHLPIEVAGTTGGGQGRDHAIASLSSADLNPSGGTAIGDGMTTANTMLVPPSSAARKAMLVLTDGVETAAAYISSVALGAGIRAYAVGLGLPQNINVDKLSAVTGNTGGYLLVTGDLDSQNEFRLHKYFAQILAGISADSIVVDPRAEIAPGETQRVPFYVTEADTQFDAVLLSHYAGLRFSLEAPDGTRIDEGNVGSFNGEFVRGQQCRYYRMRLPVISGSLSRNLGKWHLVILYPGRRSLDQPVAGIPTDAALQTTNRDQDFKRRLTTEFNPRRGYNVLVRARSSIQMDATVQQRGFGPGADSTIVAHLRAFGLPLQQNVSLIAQVTRPDGINLMIPLAHAGAGRYEARLDGAKLPGTYHVTLRAVGQTPGNWPLQREQSLTNVVVDPTAKTEADLQADALTDLLGQQQETLRELLKSQDERLRSLETTLRDLLGRLGAIQLPPGLLWGILVLILLLLLIIWILLQH